VSFGDLQLEAMFRFLVRGSSSFVHQNGYDVTFDDARGGPMGGNRVPTILSDPDRGEEVAGIRSDCRAGNGQRDGSSSELPPRPDRA
jgi:hypothetical protein